jgi:hypothetical protein
MLTTTEVDKSPSDMTDGELTAIVAECRHALRTRRYANGSHYRYLKARLDMALAERSRR